MRPGLRRATRLASALCLWLVASVAGAEQLLVQHDEKTLSRDAIEFQPGVFRIDAAGQKVAFLCIPVQGRWKQVGSGRDCGNPPPPEMQREITRFSPDHTVLGIRNLGVSSSEWSRVQQAGASGAQAPVLHKLAAAFDYAVTGSDTRWRFDSAKLPPELRAEIPGSGIHVHFGGFLSPGHAIALLGPKGGGDFAVEARLAVPGLALGGQAYTGITVGVDLRALTADGKSEEIPVIVSLLHPRAGGREAIGSDGRVSFVNSFLGTGTRYVEAIQNRERGGPWSDQETFAFRITRGNIERILSELNARRKAAGAVPFDERALGKVAVVGITLRNESRFLDKGNVAIQVVVDYLRAVRR